MSGFCAVMYVTHHGSRTAVFPVDETKTGFHLLALQ
jgi:hypothetical protein